MNHNLLLALALASPFLPLHADTLPARAVAGYERIELPDGEGMGLLRVSELVEFSPGWWAGASLYGAASGRRGGLFTWGAEVERRWRLGERLELGTTLYVGAGGGAAAPVGGGLMLRPSLVLDYGFGNWRAGVSASQVRFPSDSPIRSTQWGLHLAYDHEARYTAPGAASGDGGGIGMRRVGLLVGQYDAANAGGSAGLVGARLSWPLGDRLSATFDMLGAATGEADGFAEFTGGVLGLWPLWGPLSVGGQVQVGLAGGGAVPTGPGPIGKASLAAALDFGDWRVLVQGGRVRAFDGDLASRFVQVAVDAAIGSETGPVRNTTAAFTVQRWQQAARKTGGEPGITTAGFKFRRDLGGPWYAAAQAHGAATGNAGAFSVGGIGAGFAWRPDAAPAWRAGAELLAGAAGGGGIDNGGGALLQGMVWGGRDVGRFSRVELGLGAVKSVKGELSTPMVELAWTLEFGLR